jgi:hypothetical protein
MSGDDSIEDLSLVAKTFEDTSKQKTSNRKTALNLRNLAKIPL